MEKEIIKQSIVAEYGKLAATRKKNPLSRLFACCDSGENARQVGKAIGYSEAELNAVPEMANLGVGCGNPAAMAHIQPGETVVDLGSGAGFDAFIVQKEVGPRGKVIGVDLSDEMLHLARKNAKKGAYSNVEFRKGDIEALPLQSNIADHVISNCVINLSLHKDKVFQEAFRVLQPGGRLSISDIILEKDLPDFVKTSLAGHVACVAGAEPLEAYLKYLTTAGFVEVKVVSKSPFPLELMLTDPNLQQVAKQMDFSLDSDQAKEIAARVSSIGLTARKPVD